MRTLFPTIIILLISDRMMPQLIVIGVLVKFTLGQYKEAIIDYDKAIQLKPSEHKPHSNEGNIISLLLEDTKFDEAEVYINRGVAKSQLGKHEGALADYDEAIRLKPNYAEAYNNRGQTNTLLGNHQDSLTDYNEAIRLKPDYAEAYYNRGTTKVILGRYAEAIADLNEAIRSQSNSVSAYANRGSAKMNLGRIDEARSDFQKALELVERHEDNNLKAFVEAKLQQLNNSTL